MINVNFTERELETLKEYFQSELYKAEQKIDSIRGILDKIGKKYGKPSKAEKKALKREKKKMTDELRSIVLEGMEKKRPGRKPKAAAPVVKAEEPSERKRRGRPPKAERKVMAAAVLPVAEAPTEIPRKRGRRPSPKAEMAVEKPKRGRKSAAKVTEAATPKTQPAKRGPKPKALKAEPKKRGPRPKVEAVAVEKNAVTAKADKPAPKKRGPKPKAVKVVKKVDRRKEPRGPKISWGDWIMVTLRNHEENLSQEAIVSAIADRLKISGEELPAARQKITDGIGKLLKARKINPVTDESGKVTAYALKITGKGL